MTWDPITQAPVASSVALLTRPQVQDMVLAAASAPYEDPLGLEPQFAGWTCLEVMIHKQAQQAAQTGETTKVEAVQDRLLGRPKQMSIAVKVEQTYEEFLLALGNKAEPIDAHKVPDESLAGLM